MEIVEKLRSISEELEQLGGALVHFPELDSKDEDLHLACKVIKQGGALDFPTLAELLYYIADMLE